MKSTLRQSMAWLHTWTGLIAGWLLFAIFLSGTLACFDKELDYWMQPALQRLPPGAVAIDAAVTTLRQLAPHAQTLYLRPPSHRDPAIHGFAFEPGKSYLDVAINPRNGQLLPATVGGNFFFTLHYNLQMGTPGLYLVGLAGMLMLIAIVSGLITHRRLLKDFFLFRPRPGGQRAWLDGHNLSGVLGLPFHLMIAYTGVVIMVNNYMPAGIQLAYHGDTARFYKEALGSDTPPAPKPYYPLAHLAPLGPILADASQRLENPILYVELQHVHDTAATISVLEEDPNQVADGRRTLIYDGVNGTFREQTKGPSSAYRAYQFLSGLHRAQFGGAIIRWLYFLLGGVGCVMLACGIQIWLTKRVKQADRYGYRLIRAVNMGVIAGMPLASITLLWLNRLVPADWATHAVWEARGFWITWLLAILWSLLRLRQGQPWRELFGTGALLLLTLPLLNAITYPHSSLLYSLMRAQWTLAGVDLTAFGLGLLLAWLAWKSSRHQASQPCCDSHPSHRTASLRQTSTATRATVGEFVS